VNAVIMPLQQQCERITIAGSGRGDEPRICIAADIRPPLRPAPLAAYS
jgi:hypothetical protein